MPDVTLDFNAINYTLIPVESTDIAFTGILQEDGYTLNNLATTNSTHEFGTIRGGGHNDHDANDDVPLTTFASTNVILTKDGGGPFNVVSMQFDTFDSGGSATITITGTQVGGATVQQVFVTDTVLSLQTVVLTGFTNLTQLVFTSASTNIQFDNIIVNTDAGPVFTEGDDVYNVPSSTAVNLSTLGGNDTVNFGAFFSNDDIVNGGAGTDKITLSGGYNAALGSGTQNITNVETVQLLAGAYTLTLADIFLGAGQTITFDGSSLTAGQAFTFNGSLETNGNFEIKGGAAADNITGGAGNDVIIAGAGADIQNGGAGNDIYLIDNAGDVVTEGAALGLDTVFSTVSYTIGNNIERLGVNGFTTTNAVNLTGNSEANEMWGNDGANVIDGRDGADLMFGYGGNDVFIVNHVGDIVIEAVGGGLDTIFTSVGMTINDNIERVGVNGFTTTYAINLTGNSVANEMWGNDGVNILDGAGGADIMNGFGGNDVYFVDNVGDVINETGTGGYDTIFTSVSYTIGDDIERLAVNGASTTTALSLIGNSKPNEISGNNGGNLIAGQGGSDILIGNGGNDLFVFTSSIYGGSIDQIVDFQVGADRIGLDDSEFAGLTLGVLPAGAFYSGSAAHDSDDRIIYNPATGQLFFDADGNGAGVAVQFANLSNNLALSASDFQVI
jgi:Ca2+-binding RTX toxin-like protein